MNWDHQLSAILSAADGSVAKMRERLTSPGKFSKAAEDLFPVKDCAPNIPAIAAVPQHQPSPALSLGVEWADLTFIKSQFQMQSQEIESLTQKLHRLEMEKQCQQHHIQALQEEVCSLREKLKNRDLLRTEEGPALERRMEQWRRDVGGELGRLRERVARAASLGTLEESLSAKLLQEDLEHVRREVDQLKTRLRRQEDGALLQKSEARETRRQYDSSCKLLEELTDSYRTRSADLMRTVSQYSHIQRDIDQIREAVSELKDEVRTLKLGVHKPTPLLSGHGSILPPPVPHSQSRVVRTDAPESDSEEFSPTPSLAEISSDDLSWLDDKIPETTDQESRPPDIVGPGSDLESSDGGDDLQDDSVDLDLGSDLGLNDL
uniref:Epidermal growth factor receptor pathway substrate 15 n=1 Tax=Oryzias latipes TaxID=8090 RepID=A0A3P9MPG6_ORYLA